MQTALKVLSLTAKILSLLVGAAAYSNMLPGSWMGVALIVFGVASVLKDAVNRVGDLLDDGKENQSFK